MPTPDLPAELWMQVLSYLPQATVRKMIGVNRLLFELALDDIYKTVHFISNDRRMVRTFRRLRDLKSLARRVQCLQIWPEFLAAPIEDCNQSAFKRKILLAIGHLRLQNPSFKVLATAKEAVKHCHNIQEIKVKFDDWEMTPPFISFMDSLWLVDSIGPNITKLSVETTYVNVSLFLEPLFNLSCVLTNLRAFDLKLWDRRHTVHAHWYQATQALLSFLWAFKDTLTCIVISSEAFYDHAPLFDNFPHISQLKEFRFAAVVLEATMINAANGNLTKLLSKHACTLEVLIISTRSSFETQSQSLEVYNMWLEKNSVPPLVLPRLHTLHVHLL